MKKRILVIEDEREIALIIRLRLEISGYDVIQAFDGQDGLQKAKTLSPDLILLDLVLPKIGGEQILNELKDNDKFKHSYYCSYRPCSKRVQHQRFYLKGGCLFFETF